MKIWKLIKEGEGYKVYESQVRDPEEWKDGGYVLKETEEIPEIAQGWEYTLTGGQYPELIVYDPQRVRIEWLSAREREEWEKGKLKVEGLLDWYPTSVHHGWKIVRRQALLILDINGQVYADYTIESYDPQEPTEKDIERVESLLKDALKRVIDGDQVIEKTREPDPENPHIYYIRYEKCEHCKRLQKKFEYASCLVHSIYESITSTSPRKSVVVVRNDHLKDENLKSIIERVVIQPSPSVSLAVLTKEGEVLFLKREGKPLVKLNLLKDNVFDKEVLENA